MPATGDPYRILGLRPDATLAEVKRAYRRLAKANHPDTAGEAAIPRFLAIRAAYEMLVGAGDGRRRRSAARSPWEADPERARATRDAWRSRAGRRPGADAEDDAASGGSQHGTSDGGSASARSSDRGSSARGPSSRARRTTGAQRPPNRATPGSTSYDFADDAYDPEWSGASGYGPSSGTYWTINPKEYADPRKHGPEYQARARRGGGRPADPGESREEPIPGPASTHDADDTAAPEQTSLGGARAAAFDPAPDAPRDAGETDSPAAAVATDNARFDPLAGLPLPFRTRSRIALALVGWPPIGLGLAVVLGELTGCGRFAAGCVETFAVGTWLAQAVLFVVLLALPALAAVAAVGSLAVLAVAIPAAVFLSAVGGSRAPSNAASILVVVLVVAWLAGVALAIRQRPRAVAR